MRYNEVDLYYPGKQLRSEVVCLHIVSHIYMYLCEATQMPLIYYEQQIQNKKDIK